MAPWTCSRSISGLSPRAWARSYPGSLTAAHEGFEPFFDSRTRSRVSIARASRRSADRAKSLRWHARHQGLEAEGPLRRIPFDGFALQFRGARSPSLAAGVCHVPLLICKGDTCADRAAPRDRTRAGPGVGGEQSWPDCAPPGAVLWRCTASVSGAAVAAPLPAGHPSADEPDGDRARPAAGHPSVTPRARARRGRCGRGTARASLEARSPPFPTVAPTGGACFPGARTS